MIYANEMCAECACNRWVYNVIFLLPVYVTKGVNRAPILGYVGLAVFLVVICLRSVYVLCTGSLRIPELP